MHDQDEIIERVKNESDRHGYSIRELCKILNARHPDTHYIGEGTMYRIFRGKNKKPQRYHLWMFRDWLDSLNKQ